MKVYWVDHTVESAANLAETGAAETDYLATFIISSDTADIESVGALPALRVAQGTIFEDIPLPDSVSVYVGDTEYKGIGVTWNKSGYNEGVPAVYTLTGALNTDDLLYRNLSNKQNLTAAVQVTVEEKEIIKENYSYSDVQLGGGGFVTGIVFHPLNPNLGYARTDVGGAYRFDRTTGKWTCISDWLPHNNMFGIDAIAVDPNDENVVYMQAGTYWYKQGHALYKSTDKGETWTDISFTNDSRVFSGNSVNRMAGEALAVDPNNANIIYSGTRINGLWVTKNGGSSWTKTTLPVTSLDKGNACTGIRSVAVDDVDGNSVAYAAVYGYSDIAGGVYQSTDNGTTWTLLAGSPDKPLNLKVFNHDVYVSSGEMLNSSVAASFYKFDSTAGEWIDMTPEGLESAGSFDVYENEAGQAVIYLAESKKGASIYKKIGEEAWVKEFTAETITCDVSESASWFTDKFSQLLGIYAYTGDLIIVDNSGTKEMWITDGGVGIWYNADVENSNAFSSKVSGVDVLSMVSMNIPVDSASANKIWTTNYDYGIIASSDVTDSKAAKMYRKFKDYSWFGKVYDIDTCDADANFIAFTTSVDGEQVVGLSSNGGKTMHYGDYYPEYSTGKLAVSSVKNADGVPNIVTIPYGTDAAVMYSVDFNSWAYSDIPAGLLTDTRYNIIDSDTVNANVFYIYDAANAKVYTSYDAGETFTGTDAALRGAQISHMVAYIFRPLLQNRV